MKKHRFMQMKNSINKLAFALCCENTYYAATCDKHNLRETFFLLRAHIIIQCSKVIYAFYVYLSF